MVYLLSKPDNWELREHDLRRYLEIGINKTRETIAELKKLGYIERKQIRLDSSKWQTTTTAIYEIPELKDTVAQEPCNRNRCTATVRYSNNLYTNN